MCALLQLFTDVFVYKEGLVPQEGADEALSECNAKLSISELRTTELVKSMAAAVAAATAPCVCEPCAAAAPCEPCAAAAAAPAPQAASTAMPRGVVHRLLGNLQIDNPYLGTQGVPEGLCLDVGGHLGWTAEQVAVYGHRVYVFEPFAGNHPELEKNMAPYGDKVKIFKGAVSNVDGEVSFGGGSPGQKQDIASAGEYGKFVSKGSSSDNLISGGPGPKVKSYRIDDVVGDTEKVLFFKIDVQGFELVRSSRSLLCHDHLIPPADLCAAACCRARAGCAQGRGEAHPGSGAVNTTACKRLFSLGCVPHTDGAVFQPAEVHLRRVPLLAEHQAHRVLGGARVLLLRHVCRRPEGHGQAHVQGPAGGPLPPALGGSVSDPQPAPWHSSAVRVCRL